MLYLCDNQALLKAVNLMIKMFIDNKVPLRLASQGA